MFYWIFPTYFLLKHAGEKMYCYAAPSSDCAVVLLVSARFSDDALTQRID